MKTWSELYNSVGVFVSNVIDASSSFDYYIANATFDYKNNDGIVTIDMRVTHDGGLNWSEWTNINDGIDSVVFDGNGIKMIKTKFQYRITMDMSQNVYGNISSFNSLSIMLTGAYKIDNTGDINCLPEIWLKKTVGSGEMVLTNETTGKTFTLVNINKDETVYVDNENRDIDTDLPLKYRYGNHNKEWFELQDGENIITGTGNYELKVRHEFKVLQG